MVSPSPILNFFFRFLNKVVSIRIILVSIVFLGFIFAFSFPIQSEVANAASALPDVTRSKIDTFYLQAVNTIRISHHLKPLLIDDRLDRSAYFKNIDMINNNYWGHVSPSEINFSDFIWSQSSSAFHVGENLARCFNSDTEVMQAFIESPSHYANIIGDYDDVGVSVITNPTTQCEYVTMHFASYK